MKVSFVVPVFNGAEFLPAALQSLFDNACAGVELEIIVIDDCSTDPQTLLLLSQLEAQASVRILRHAENGGPAKARNTGIRAATGDWIAFLDADDLLAPGTMVLRRDVIAAHPYIRWLAGDALEIRRPGEFTHTKSFSVSASDGKQVLPGIFELKRPVRKLVQWSTLPSTGSMMLRRDLVHEVGLFDESLTYGEDNHFCLITAALADLYWVDKPCLYFRRYNTSMTKDVFRMACESPRYTGRLVREARLRVIRKELRWQHAASWRLLSRLALARDLRMQALRAALLSVLWTPNDSKSYKVLYQAIFVGGTSLDHEL